MKNIKIRKFGPISKANIDITPMTVFIGVNNSGKSFLAQIIHCLNKSNYNL